jgi:hypothetical protein
MTILFHPYLLIVHFFPATIGREIQVSAGFQHVVPKADKKKSNKENDALFEVIEDVEEKPIPTPLYELFFLNAIQLKLLLSFF